MDADALFTINAGQILAKLHLAGKTQAPNFVVINTGIKGESKSDTPENPGKTMFDFSNKTGEYEACFVATGIEYKEKLDLNKDPAIAKANKEIEKQKKAHAKLTDDQKSVSKAVQERNKQISKYLKDVKIDSSDEEIKEALEKENKTREEEKKKLIEKTKQSVMTELTNYFKSFCGDKYKQPKGDQVVMLQMKTDFKESKDAEVKDFKVEKISDKDFKKWKDEYLKKQDKPVTVSLGFKVTYNVNVDAM